MISFLPDIKLLHITVALASGGLFAVRGAGRLAGMRWPMAMPVRYLSYAIDMTLLTAGLMLLNILPAALFGNGWLHVKIGFLVAYIVLGVFALHRARRTWVRAALLGCALGCYLQIYAIARTHHPLGLFYLLQG